MEKKVAKSADIKELKARKKALHQEMDAIQTDIESSLNVVRDGMMNRVRLRYWVEKYPLHIVGTALVTGFVFALRSGRRKSSDRPASGTSSRGIFLGLLTDELKKAATQRTVRYLMSRIEQAIDERKQRDE